MLCDVVVVEGVDGARHGTWTPGCWKALQDYEVIAEGNTKIAQANADALRNTEAGYTTLINAGKMQQQLTEFYTDLLEEERSGRFIDSLMYKTLIGLSLLVVIP